MASPQLENGHTRVANELLREIYRFPFSASGLRIVLWVMRGSYGWNNKLIHEWSYRGAAEELKMPVGSVHFAMQVLIDGGVLINDVMGRLRLNKDYETWSSVQPTEQKVFGPLNETVRPTEQKVFGPLNAYKDKDKQLKKERKGTTIPPELDWVIEYCSRPGPIKGNRIDPHKFYDSCKAVGWMRGKSKIKDWHAAVRTWEMREQSGNSKMTVADLLEQSR